MEEDGFAPSELMGSSAAPTARSEGKTGMEDVVCFVDEECMSIVIDGIVAIKIPRIVDEKWPTLADAVYDAAKTWRDAGHTHRLHPSSSTEPPSSGEAKGRE